MNGDARKQHILMVLESVYPTSGGGGAENQVRTLADYLRNTGNEISIVAPMTPDSPRRVLDKVDGIEIRRIPYPYIRILGGLVLSGRLLWYLFARRRQYDVIHAHIAHNMAAVSCLAGRLLGKTVVIKFTGWMELENGVLSPSRNGPGDMLRRFALRRADHVQATSRAIRKRLLERGFRPERVHVIPNAVDLKRFSVACSAERAGALTGIYVGRLVPVKALDILVGAWIAAIPAHAPMQLLLVGDGELRTVIDERIRKAGRTGQIRVLGAQSAVELLLAQADFGLLVSLSEGLSNTLLEYMAAGLPVLGSRVSGTEDMIEPEVSGWLVPPGDSGALTAKLEAVARMSKDELRTMGRAAEKRVRHYAGIESVTQRLERLYQSRHCGPSPRGARSI